jgi:hypothetical protein
VAVGVEGVAGTMNSGSGGDDVDATGHCAQSRVFNLKRVVENFKLSVK